jgi:uncharacterized SAM-binding protein YcdF (DUF218 family)
MHQKNKLRRPRRVVALLFIPALLFFGLAFSLDRWGQSDHAQKADAIVVLGAYVQPHGKASAALRSRALHAAELYKHGFASHIITTGGVGDNPPAEALVAAKILRENGVPQSAIVSEITSTSTWENATNADKICRQHGWKKVVIVSEPFHLFRATRNFQKQGLQAFASPAPDNRFRFRVWMTLRETPLVLRDLILRRI